MWTDALFPVYVLAKDCGEIDSYTSIENMQSYLEAIDVENNEYEAWDAEGRLLELTVSSRKPDWLQITRTDSVLSPKKFAEIKAKVISS